MKNGRSFTRKIERILRMGRVPVRVALVYLLLLTFAPSAYAQDPAAGNEADDGLLEVGVHYVVDYQNCGGWGLGDLPATAPDAIGLRNRLTATHWFPPFFTYPTPRWQSNYTWGNGLAWEEDWKRSASGGTEEFYVDNVDFAYFAGHGAASGFFFGVGGNTHDDCQVTKSDASGAWGTKDNDWIGLAACNVLDDPFSNFQGWAGAMNGTRLLMGFQTVMSDVPFGDSVGWNIRWGNTMTQAWFRAANSLLPSTQVARILAEHSSYFNDTQYNHNSFTAVDNTFHWWTHRAGTAIVTAADLNASETLAQLGGEMPIFAVEPLSLEEAENEYAQVANAFGLTSTVPITSFSAADALGTLGGESAPIFVSNDGSLLMDPSAGIYDYVELDTLWNAEVALANQVAAANGDAIRAVTQDEAKEIADSFLEQTGLGSPDDSAYAGTVSDILTTAINGKGASAADIVQEEVATNYIVDYARTLNYQTPVPNSAEAAGAAIQFTVVGPGPKLSVYVDATVPAGLSAAEVTQDAVIGGQGGWRQVSQAMAADGSAMTVTMLPTQTVALLFNELESRVALDYVPLPTDDKEIVSFTPTYYEGPMGMNMDQLIPIYDLLIRATTPASVTASGAAEQQEYHVYVPVNTSYMAPYAEILEPARTSVTTGETVTLTAADASQTLAELGHDASLNYALGTGDPDSYVYQWYLNVVSDTLTAEGGLIGSGMTIDYQIPAGSALDGKPSEVKLILVVTDVLKNGDPKIARDEVVLTANPIFLPTVAGQQ